MKIQYQQNGLTLFESALYRTTSAIVEWGNAIVIVDPNWLPCEIENIREYVNSCYADRKKYLLFTHSDFDHIIGYGAFPDCQVIGSADFADNPAKEMNVQQILSFDDQYYIHRPYPVVYPGLDIVVRENNTIMHEGTEAAYFYVAPGHIDNGLIVVFPEKKLCIAGDYLSNIEIPMVEFSFHQYAETLQTFRHIFQQHSISRLVTGHGDMAKDRDEIQKRLNTDFLYTEAFIKDFDITHSVFENTIQQKGNVNQNRKIHQNNITFFKSKDTNR
jgi:hydroxyacylglutathione hydrolase